MQKRDRLLKKQQPKVVKMWVENVHCQQFFKTGGFQWLFKVEAQKEKNVNKEKEEGLIKWQLAMMFQTATAKLEKADKEINLAIQPDNNRHMPNM